ncbi:ThiJ domain-containing protein [Schizosaccharomyces cryophilus OY26]|uniref:D-lactate dehydratase n=1 Tax=Schizosaccharomyces cryophilus (strain OY26 / ATCC MYA-4695 / CBS 11777 / NBRC 106824 / NRRL Y48691) TaxID=653667 RepID=S9VYV6_SCHCR|nr:ThiJ domain-containing protein [Schizosaccharomyces cryophilus OY26]EPY51394.1 ThiJ domain-containing protein [Schizosaccharomyces cryophilus OY26]
MNRTVHQEKPSLLGKALILMTSYYGPFYDDGDNTGACYPEIFELFHILENNGFDVEFASDTGDYGFDCKSVREPYATKEALDVLNDPESILMIKLKTISRLSRLNPNDYDAVIVSGGYGCYFNYSHCKDGQGFMKAMFNKDKVIATVAEGVLLLACTTRDDGHTLCWNRRITGCTWRDSIQSGVHDVMKKLHFPSTEDIAKESGAIFKSSPVYHTGGFVIEDGNIITGSNTNSAEAVAKQVLKTLKKQAF